MKKLQTLSELISIKSDNQEGEEILAYLKNTLKDKVEEIRLIKGERNILIGINTKLKDIEPVVLSGHIDTVNADEKNYITDPYKLTIKEDKAYGLGIIDMKCFTSSIVDILDVIKKYNYPIILALTTDEETGLEGIKNVIKEFQMLNIKPKFTIVGEPTSMKINNTSNGCFEYKVEVYGKSCHSSMPQNGINSICILAKIVTYIEELSGIYDNLVMNSNVIKGGTIVNRIPDYAYISFDIRTTSIVNYQEVIKLLENKIQILKKEYGTEIKLTKVIELPPLSCKCPEIINKLAKKLNLEVTNFSGGCEAGYYEKYSGCAILFGTGDISLAHKPNEYMVIEDYFKYNELLIAMLEEIKVLFY